MLKSLFSSTTRVKLLSTFLLSSSEDEYYIRELTRVLDEQINSVRRELDNLKKIGLLRVKSKNRKKFYKVNTDFVLYEDLRNLFQKGSSRIDEISKAIAKTGKVDILIMSGFFVGKTDGVDFIVVGDVDKNKLQKYISEEVNVGRELKYSIFTREDFLYRIECKDKFVVSILNDTKNLTVINKIEKMLGK